jgi:hypothetical protein
MPLHEIHRVTKTARSPAIRKPPVTVSNLVVGRAADLEGDGEAGAEDDIAGAEDAVCGVEDEDDGESPSAAARVGSGIKSAETPEELKHVVDVGVPTPSTKFTAMHCSWEGKMRKVSYIARKSGRRIEQLVRDVLEDENQLHTW